MLRWQLQKNGNGGSSNCWSGQVAVSYEFHKYTVWFWNCLSFPATESPSLISSLVFSVRGGSWTTSSAERRALRPSDEHWMCPMAPCPSSTTAPRSTRGSGATMRPWGHGVPWVSHGLGEDHLRFGHGGWSSWPPLASLKWWSWATFVAWLWEKTVWRVWTFPVANCWWPPWMTTGLYRLLNYMSSIWPLINQGHPCV